MANISVYYEEHEIHGWLMPTRVNVYLGRGGIEWKKERVYLPFEFNYRKMTADDVFPDVTSVLVMAGDLIRHPVDENKFGIYIPFIVERMEQHKLSTGAKYEYEDIEQFIIQVPDIESVMLRRMKSLYNEEDF
ncbi:hypothetical protein D3C73_726650 [compost metagenome]